MAGLTFFLAVVVSLQVAQDGVHSCTLRSHYKAEGPQQQSACSTPGAADPTSGIPRRTPPASCATPALGLPYHPDALNRIPSISPFSFKSSHQTINPYYYPAPPPVAGPHYLTPLSADASGNDRILVDLLLKYFATAPDPLPLPLPPSSPSFRGSAPGASPQPSVFATPTPYYPAVTPNPPQISSAELQQQFLSFLMSVSGPGSDSVNPAVPSGVPSLPPAPVVVPVTEPPTAVVATNDIEAAAAAGAAAAVAAAAATSAAAAAATEATHATVATPATEASAAAAAGPVDYPKLTSSAPVAPPSSLPASDPAGGVPPAVQTPGPGPADVPALAPIVVVPEASGSALGPAAIPEPVDNSAPAADPVSASTPDVASPLSEPPSDATAPASIV